MRQSLKRTILIVAAVSVAALVTGIPTAAPETGLQNVTLACSDGTNLDLALDLPTVSALADAVDAMNFYPAGDPPLTCGLTQSNPLLQPAVASSSSRGLASKSAVRGSVSRAQSRSQVRTLSASGNPNHDYAVGGGQAANLGCPDLPTNFALSAHVDDGSAPTTASGTFNVGSPAPNGVCKGHFNSKVDCLVVGVPAPNYAHLTAHVTQATGIFTGLQDTEIDVWVQDNGNPSAIVPDMINDGNVASGAPCAEGVDARGGPTAPDEPVVHGNVTVHG
jgi:hypothetical protein